MSNIPITSLPGANPLTGEEAVPIVQAGTTKRATTGAISALPFGSAGGSASGISFVTVSSATAALPSSRILAATSPVQITDGGAGSTIGISLNTVPVSKGGTGATSLSANGVVLGNGTSALSVVAAGTSAYVLMSTGSATPPSYQLINLTQSITGVLGVPNGGTGTSTLTANSLLLSHGSSPVTVVANGTSGYVLTSTGIGSAPTFQAATGGVTSLQGLTGALTSFYFPPQGRLTLGSANPVPTSSILGAITVYYTMYSGGVINLYDGTNFVPTAFTELSVATNNTTTNPSAIGASKVNDWFVWNSSGMPTLIHGPDWTNDTTRSAGTVLTRISGVWLNSVPITNGPGTARGIFVGTTRSNSTASIDFNFGGTGSGGIAAFFGVWNTYNRVSIGAAVVDSGPLYTYTSGTVRQANNSSGNQISYVMGLQEDTVWASYSAGFQTSGTIGSIVIAGIGLDSTTTYYGQRIFTTQSGTSQALFGSTSAGAINSFGVHTITAVEASDGTHANSYNVNSTNILSAQLRL